MNNHRKNKSTLSIILFIIVVSLVSSISNMISPNLLIISNFFGFGGNTAPLGTLTFTFTIMTGITMLFFGFLADKIVRKWIVLTGTLVFSVFFYAIFISIIISWLTYFGIYNVRQYHTISIFISHLSSDKEFSIKLNFKSFKSKGIPFIMENYAKISIRVFIPASILLGIGFMYLFAFNYILAGIFYALIGGIIMVILSPR